MKKIYNILLFSIFLLLIGTIIFMKVNNTTKNKHIVFSGNGNTMSNIRNWGYCASNDKYICCTYNNDHLLIYNNKDKILKEIEFNSIYFLNVVDDWVYFTDGFPGKVYRYSIYDDFTQCISNKKVCYLIVINNNIYAKYSHNNQGMICKMNLDGTRFKTVVKNVGEDFDIYNDMIYYSNSDDNGYIYRCNLNGENNEKYLEYNAVEIELYNDKIYFIDSGKQFFYSAEVNSKNTVYMCKGIVANYNIFNNGIILYMNNSLYKSDFKLDNIEKLSDGKFCNINVFGNKVMYINPITDKYRKAGTYIIDLDENKLQVMDKNIF